ncbi:MAG: class I SAM-dependent methyltransferase [Phycisphaerales bacterium]|nr:MAG: class I SAM-dependent methyltransferase [Phycisphaerales bacterium]
MIDREMFTRARRRFHSVFRYYLRLAAYRNPFVFERVFHKIGHASDNRSPSFWDRELAGTKAAYLKTRISSDVINTLTATLIRNFAPGVKSLLDVGCAGGHMALAGLKEGLENYVGIDISEYAIENARKNVLKDSGLQSVKFYCCDLCDYTSNSDGPFDAIVFTEVLYYLSVKEVIEQLNRYANWLKPGGVFCITMKDDPKSHAIYRGISRRFEVLHGVLFQCSPHRLKYRIYISQEHGAFLLGVFRPVGLQ